MHWHPDREGVPGAPGRGQGHLQLSRISMYQVAKINLGSIKEGLASQSWKEPYVLCSWSRSCFFQVLKQEPLLEDVINRNLHIFRFCPIFRVRSSLSHLTLLVVFCTASKFKFGSLALAKNIKIGRPEYIFRYILSSYKTTFFSYCKMTKTYYFRSRTKNKLSTQWGKWSHNISPNGPASNLR